MEMNEAGPDSFKYTVAEKAALFNADDNIITLTKAVRLK